MKTALIHDWLLSHGGAEDVLQKIIGLYPGDLFTLAKNEEITARYGLHTTPIHTSFLSQLPSIEKYFKFYLPLFPFAIEQFDLREYDLVLSLSHCVAKGVLTTHEQLHICYCHSPMRYAWDMYHAYLHDAKLTRGIKGLFAKFFLHKLRMWDFASSQRVDHFLANSHYIAKRIQKNYGRQAHVIYPGIPVNRFPFSEQKEDFYLTASRLVPYKKIRTIIEAFHRMPSKKLIVIGSGDELETIREMAQPNVTVLGFVENDLLKEYLKKAKGFLFAALEDFGILPVEAQSCGTPVICLGKGGTAETVLHEKTGVHFHEQTPDAIQRAVEHFETLSLDPYSIRENALRFSEEVFNKQLSTFINMKYEAFQSSERTHAPEGG